LVLEAQIGGFTSKKVFMDEGSSLNLVYADTLQKIKIPMNELLPSGTSFHGIVPGKLTYPLGVITLDVIFGTPTNFRKEKIEFEVVDWPAYFKLRMPGNIGPLMISAASHVPKTATKTSTPCPRHSGFMRNSITSERAPTWT
jgi:hypothetical protein